MKDTGFPLAVEGGKNVEDLKGEEDEQIIQCSVTVSLRLIHNSVMMTAGKKKLMIFLVAVMNGEALCKNAQVKVLCQDSHGWHVASPER